MRRHPYLDYILSTNHETHPSRSSSLFSSRKESTSLVSVCFLHDFLFFLETRFFFTLVLHFSCSTTIIHEERMTLAGS
jgi:hypothetical protein